MSKFYHTICGSRGILFCRFYPLRVRPPPNDLLPKVDFNHTPLELIFSTPPPPMISNVTSPPPLHTILNVTAHLDKGAKVFVSSVAIFGY